MLGRLISRIFGLPTAAAEGMLDVFVMAGQSNMQGLMGDAEAYPPDQELDRNIRMYWMVPSAGDSRGQWTSLQPQAGIFPKGHFGPEVTFARALLQAGYRPAIFKFSKGTTSLATDWKEPGTGGLYDIFVAELRKAILQLEREGCRAKIRALVWIQGETDAQNFQNSTLYGKHLRLLLDDFRANIAEDIMLPVLLGVDEAHPYVQWHPGVLTHQKRLAASLPRVAFTSMIGLEKADLSHLTPAGIVAHGLRLFADFQALVTRP